MPRGKQKEILTKAQITAIAKEFPKGEGLPEGLKQRIATLPDETKRAVKQAWRLKLRADQLTRKEAQHATRKN